MYAYAVCTNMHEDIHFVLTESPRLNLLILVGYSLANFIALEWVLAASSRIPERSDGLASF